MSKLTPTYDAFVDQLRQFRRKEKRMGLQVGLLRLAGAALPTTLITVAIESVFSFAGPGRIGLVLFVVVALVLAFSRWVVPSLINVLLRPEKPSLIETAVKVGGLYKGVNDRLANALEVFRKHESNRENYSVALINAALAQIAGSLTGEDFSQKIDFAPARKSLRYTSGVLASTVLIWLFFASAFNSAAYRLLHPLQDFSAQSNISLLVFPGNKTVLKGEDVPVKVWSSEAKVASVDLSLTTFNNAETVKLQKSRDDTFRYTIESVKDSLRYYAAVGKAKSPAYQISVLELPLLRNLQVKVTPPAYSRLEPYMLEENVGDVNALKGSRLQISGECNKTIAEGKIVFESGDSLAVDVVGQRLTASFSLQEDDSYFFELKDRHGYASNNPIEYHLKVIPDQYPFINVPVPGRDVDLGEDMLIPITIEAQDDYGISRLQLAYQIIPGGEGELDSTRFLFQNLEGLNYGAEQLNFAFNWELSKSNMLPNDLLVYFVEAYDNDTVSGPKKARSKIYRARFPSIYELYQEVVENQADATEQLENVYEKSQQLKKEIEDLSLEMKRSTDFDWQKQQQVEAALKQHREMQEQLEQLSDKMEQMIESMEKNNLVSAETMKKYQELQQLFKEIMTPELKKAMEKVAEAMQNLDQQLIQKAMEDLKLSEEDFKKSIERTISLLQRLKTEQKLDQAMRMTQDLAERERKLTEEANQKNREMDKLLDEQEKINENTEALSDLLKELQKEMSEQPSLPQEQIDQALAQMDSSQLAQQLEQMKSTLQSGKQADMQQQSSQIQQTFDKVAQNLQQAKEAMSGEAQRKAMQALRQGAHDLLELSKRQESLMNQTQDMPANSAQSPQAAEQQQDIASALSRTMDKIFDASKESFYIDPRIAQSLGQAAASMEKAQQEMENRNNPSAAGQQGQAMAALNEAVKDIQGSMQSMMQGSGSGMSMQQFMEQMQGMAGAQQGINQQTLGLGMGQQLSLAQQAAMARLAAEQGAVRKSMEELAKEAGNLSEILGSMDKIVEDMKEVEKDFNQQNLNRQTIERQNRILSRMLDSQRSMREREYSQKRKAETGKEYLSISPDDLPADLGERRNRLQQDLLRAKTEGYTRDYLELIRKYFEALMENEAEKKQ